MIKTSSELNDEQRALIRGMLSVGCDREAAVRAAGVTLRQLRDEIERDPEYAEELLRAEGAVELHRMKTVHNAASDEKHWRAATWWLEQKAKKRYARRNARKVTTVEWQEYLAKLRNIIFAEVSQDEDRERLLLRLFAMSNATDATLVLDQKEET